MRSGLLVLRCLYCLSFMPGTYQQIHYDAKSLPKFYSTSRLDVMIQDAHCPVLILFIQIYVRRAGGGDIPIFNCMHIRLFVYLCHVL